MQTITTTELRTKSKELVSTLLSGRPVKLIHHSKVVGEIKPHTEEQKIFSAQRMEKIAKKLNIKPLTPKEIDRRYRAAMMKKHGKHLPR